MKSILLFALITLCLGFMQCQPKASFTEIPNGIFLTTDSLEISVQFYTPDIVRVNKQLTAPRVQRTSLSVIAQPGDSLTLQTSETADSIFLSSPSLQVHIHKKTGKIKFLTPDRHQILAESSQHLTPFITAGDSGYTVQQGFTLHPDEGIYGLGQHQNGYMNYRGKQVTLVQSNTDAVNPFLISTHNYGILWDNYSHSVFEDSPEEAGFWSKLGDGIDYYFVKGHHMDDVIGGYRHLTGTAPMYGKWAFGYWQSREHYENREELVSNALEYRRRNIPIDNIIQDWDTWEGAENWNQLFFDPVKFPRPQEMMDLLHQNNFHVMVSVWCSFGPNTDVYQAMHKKRLLLPTLGWARFKYMDVYNPDATDLYWNYLKKGFFDLGMDGWWMDSTEPDIVNANTKGATVYELERMANHHLGSFTRYLNTYTLPATESVYKNQRKTSEKQRVYILTRSSFAGQQRAAATTWSGDIGADWPIFKKQIAAGVNHSMSGIPYWTFDIGAFVLGGYGGVFQNGVSDPAYQELFTRMFQFGAFCPIFRAHGSDAPRELWHYGDFTPTLIAFDRLRYRLLPYTYSLSSQVTRNHSTLMRSLAMDFSHDTATYNIADQYLFGPSFMVCPVTQYMYHKPPMATVPVPPRVFKTRDGKPGLHVSYFKDTAFMVAGTEQTEAAIHLNWYESGRPGYVTDSILSIIWEGTITPFETGLHQFQTQCYGPKRLFINGKELNDTYTGVAAFSEPIWMEAGKKYSIRLEKKNKNPGAFHVELYWKTPSMLTEERQKETVAKTREVYLPKQTTWYDFWTGTSYRGGKTIEADAPIEKMPLFVKAGSIIPMGPYVQYATEKEDAPVEVRIYPGANGSFEWYEDENDNYNYEKGWFATINFSWDEASQTLTLSKRMGTYPGMPEKREFNVVLVNKQQGIGIAPSHVFHKKIHYTGEAQTIPLH